MIDGSLIPSIHMQLRSHARALALLSKDPAPPAPATPAPATPAPATPRQISVAATPSEPEAARSCAICFDVLGELGEDSFTTPCCRQPFHPGCLEAYKASQGPAEPGIFAASRAKCPLCRSTDPTGLTPAVWAKSRKEQPVDAPPVITPMHLQALATAQAAREAAASLLDCDRARGIVNNLLQNDKWMNLPAMDSGLHAFLHGQHWSEGAFDRCGIIECLAHELTDRMLSTMASACAKFFLPGRSGKALLRRALIAELGSQMGRGDGCGLGAYYGRTLARLVEAAFTPAFRPGVSFRYVTSNSALRCSDGSLEDSLDIQLVDPPSAAFAGRRIVRRLGPDTIRETILLPPPPEAAWKARHALHKWVGKWAFRSAVARSESATRAPSPVAPPPRRSARLAASRA